MFKRIFTILIILFMSSSTFAGELEYALKNNQDVFLYLYTSFCGTCKQFNPIYENLVNNYGKKYKFLKINAETPYGYDLVRKFNAKYVPFVLLINNKRVWQIDSSCLSNIKCTSDALSNFKNK